MTPTVALKRNWSFGDLEISSKKMRLTPSEQQMVQVQVDAAKAHECKPSKLPVAEPLHGGPLLTLNATTCSLTGKRPFNEDQHLFLHTKYGDLFAVCDGHGAIHREKQLQIGAELATTVTQSITLDLPTFIEESPFNIKYAFDQWFNYIQAKLPPVPAGATVAIGFHEKVTRLLHVATLGDTEVVVFRKIENLIFPIPMSPEMNWKHPEAVGRIQRLLTPETLQKWLQIDNPKFRRFPPDKGVNVAWSLGDKLMTIHQQTAISHKPTCSLVQLQKEDLILVGCDGIFDVASVDNLIDDVLLSHWDDPQLAKRIADYAYHTKKSSDNITALVVRTSPLPETSPTPSTEEEVPEKF